MDILIIGAGGREHALAWKAAGSMLSDTVYVAPGNAGTAQEPGVINVDIDPARIGDLLDFARDHEIGLTIVGPEAPLVAGIVDAFREAGLRCFGPEKAAAQLEGSKAYAKDFLARHRIPTAAYAVFTETSPAREWIQAHGAPLVVKADGLAAGKGVIIARTEAEAIDAVEDMLEENAFGNAGHRVVIEEFLEGGSELHRHRRRRIRVADGDFAGPQGPRRRRQRSEYRRHGRLLPGTGRDTRSP